MKKIAKDDACFFTQQPFLIGTYDPEGAPRFATISWISYTFGPPACLVVSMYGKSTPETTSSAPANSPPVW